jgi:hypothetical protein
MAKNTDLSRRKHGIRPEGIWVKYACYGRRHLEMTGPGNATRLPGLLVTIAKLFKCNYFAKR